MRRLSYPSAPVPSGNAVLEARIATAIKIESLGVLFEVNDTLVAAWFSDGKYVVVEDNGRTTERFFETGWQAADCLMNLAAYAKEAA